MSRAFRALTRHFFRQFFQVELGSGDGGYGATQALSLLASPGAVMSFLLFAKYSPLMRWFRRDFQFDMDIASLPDKYTFIALSMTVTGIVAVLRWDTLFPDRRDFVNLCPLPLRSRSILLAKTLALSGFVLIFIATVNLCSTVFFPLIALEGNVYPPTALRFIAAHAIAVCTAGLWTFAAFLALMGTLMVALPYAIFRRVQRYIQFGCIVVLTLLFLSASGMGPSLEAMRTGYPVQAEWLPPAWFLGLYQTAQGKASGSFGVLGERAWQALLFAIPLATVAYGSSYRWFFLRTAETTEGSMSAFPVPSWILRGIETFLPRSGFDRACVRFVLRTLARSDRHTAALAAMLGLGIALAVQSANDPRPSQLVPVGMLAASLMVVYSLLTGLRLCFGIPSELNANWTFRVASDESADPQRVIRVVMFVFLSPVILAPSILLAFSYGWWPAVCHFVFTVAASVIVIDLLTSGFRVIPFTVSWMPGRENFVFSIAVWAIGLVVFSQGLAVLDLFVMLDPPRLIVYLVIAGLLLFGMRHSRGVRPPLTWSDTRGELDLLRISE